MTDHDTLKADVTWIKKISGWILGFLAGFSILVLTTIWMSGRQYERFENHVDSNKEKFESIDIEIEDLKKTIREILYLRERELLFKDKESSDKLSKLRKEKQENPPIIYAGIGGEES